MALKVPAWDAMDTRQRVLAGVAGVGLLVACVLIGRSFFGGGPPVEMPQAAVEAMDAAAEAGVFQPQPEIPPEQRAWDEAPTGSKKRAADE